MEKKYISVDIEASGPVPGRYSMLSIGACIVGDSSVQFYREIKPINRNYDFNAMKTSAIGLKCLDGLRDKGEYNPESKKFSPGMVLSVLDRKGETPEKVMADFARWINENTKGFRAVEAAAPIKFDGMFTAWYFGNFYDGRNPFGHSGEDINSMYRGLMKDVNAHVTQFGLRDGDLKHNALEDAIMQAKEFERVLELMKS